MRKELDRDKERDDDEEKDARLRILPALVGLVMAFVPTAGLLLWLVVDDMMMMSVMIVMIVLLCCSVLFGNSLIQS